MPCSNGCDAQVQRRHVEEHLASQCPRRDMQCDQCGAYVSGGPTGLQAHLADLCPEALVSCPACHEENLKRSLVIHMFPIVRVQYIKRQYILYCECMAY